MTEVKSITIDQSSGVLMPFYNDANSILFVAGKGDGNIRYYEYENDNLHFLSEFGAKDPQRGMTFLPRRALDVSENEVARAYKISGSTVEPLAFIVPRKAESFQASVPRRGASLNMRRSSPVDVLLTQWHSTQRHFPAGGLVRARADGRRVALRQDGPAQLHLARGRRDARRGPARPCVNVQQVGAADAQVDSAAANELGDAAAARDQEGVDA